eukprot:2104291-Pyramimonas_sp.AAC.1
MPALPASDWSVERISDAPDGTPQGERGDAGDTEQTAGRYICRHQGVQHQGEKRRGPGACSPQ